MERWLVRPFGMVEQKEDRDGDHGVGAGAEEFVAPEEAQIGEAQQTVVDEKEQDAVEEGEAEGNDDAGQRAFYIHLEPNACSDIADGRLGHSIDADGLVGERVLEQSNDGSGKRSGDGAAPRDGEEEDDDERKIEQGETWKWFREKGLQKNRKQRHKQRDGGREGVLFEFLAGGVAAIEHFLASSQARSGSWAGEFDVVFVLRPVEICLVKMALGQHCFRSDSLLRG